MNESKLCPFFNSPCKKGECALWDSKNEFCSLAEIPALADTLDNISISISTIARFIREGAKAVD